MIFKNPLPYEIHISGSSNDGFIVKVGCCTAVFTSVKEMLAAIEEFINDPDAMEKKYNKSNSAPREVECHSDTCCDPVRTRPHPGIDTDGDGRPGIGGGSPR